MNIFFNFLLLRANALDNFPAHCSSIARIGRSDAPLQRMRAVSLKAALFFARKLPAPSTSCHLSQSAYCNLMKLALAVCTLAMLIGVAPIFGADSTSQGSDVYHTQSSPNQAAIDAALQEADKYTDGLGVKKDLKKAAKYHLKAAQLGSARAQCLLGLDYADGLGVNKDAGQAVHWLTMSAQQGWPSAQFDLGLCYAMGTIPNKTAADAVVWFRKAADQGLPDAECALGNCYLDGAGVPKDIPEGIRFIRLAAEKGHAPAQRVLGGAYVKGNGVPKDLVQAYKWLDLAAAKDDLNGDDIRVNLSMAERFMTPEQIAEGQRLAKEFKPKKVPVPGEPIPPDTATNAPPVKTVAAAIATPSTTTSAASAPTTPAVSTPAVPAPASSATKTGSISLLTADDSSDVYVDGDYYGNAPTRLKLAEGTHVIEVKKAGFKDYHKQIKVTDGAELTLKVTLEKP